MDKAIYIPSAILGAILILIYTYRCHRAKREFSQAVMVNAILQSSGIICGFLLILGTFNDDAKKLLNEIDLYILIAGFAVTAASVKGIYKDIFLSTVIKPQESKASLKRQEEVKTNQ
ncbi:Threonyl-tRNA synthetase [Vibrio crassostreae]|nr:Threonyl-tRNA synthetase [Vibrio crassostreae]CAK3646276.1 Threonyl-tRNA synthetase [Vibrio crassostreae]